jgi:hypothetical protein
MQLDHVDLKADSLSGAWARLGRRFFVRSVLAVDDSAGVPGRFEFTRDACTVRELIGAMLQAYPGYELSQDPGTGILWIHPVSVPYASLLPTPVAIPPGSDQVPALQGVLRELRRQAPADIAIYHRGAVQAFESAGAFPVTLRPGLCTMRDVLNMCCQASPAQSLYIVLGPRGAIVDPGDLYASVVLGTNMPPVRPGVLRFWQLGMGKASGANPTHAEVSDALASANGHERWVARCFLGAGDPAAAHIDELITEAPTVRQAIWASLAELSIYNLALPSYGMIGFKKIQRELSRGAAETLDRGTVVLAAMEMARAGDDALLKEAARWNLGPDELATIDPDGVRIARLSSIVRAALKEANCTWPGLSAKEIRDMDEQKPLLAPQ